MNIKYICLYIFFYVNTDNQNMHIELNVKYIKYKCITF